MTTILPKFYEVFAESLNTIGKRDEGEVLEVKIYPIPEFEAIVNVIVHPQHGVLFNNDLRGQLISRNGQGEWDLKIGRSMWFKLSVWENQLIEHQFYPNRNENEQKVSDRNLKVIEFLQTLAR